MKNIVYLTILLCSISQLGFSQAKKPTIMVVPSDAWCFQHDYSYGFNNQGTVELIPNYEIALQTNTDLLLAISKIGEMMSERGFPLKDLSASLRSLKTEAAEDAVTTSADGDNLAESPIDRLKRTAKADIWMYLTWSVNKVGPKYTLTFNLQGIDAYTNKQIAAASGTGQPSFSVELPVLLEESIISHIDNFNNQLQTHFDDMFENGREISLVCRKWSGSEVDFESEFDGEELSFLIEDWLTANTVNGRYSTTDASENRMFFEQVRIPTVNANGRAIDARYWANGLRKMLKDKYEIDAKLSIRGLGQAIITLGGK